MVRFEGQARARNADRAADALSPDIHCRAVYSGAGGDAATGQVQPNTWKHLKRLPELKPHVIHPYAECCR